MEKRVIIGLFILLACGLLAVIASAAVSSTVEQWKNGNGAKLPGWDTGAINAQNSVYAEGDSVPYRLMMGGLDPGIWVYLECHYDFTKGGIHAFDFQTTDDRTESPDVTGDLKGITITPAEYAGALLLAIPDDPAIVQDDALRGAEGQQYIKIAGDVANAEVVGGPTLEGTVTGTSQKSVIIRVLTSSTPNADGEIEFLVSWSTHLSRSDPTPQGWGAGMGSGSVSGAPFHVSVGGFHDDNGNGQQDGGEGIGGGDLQIQIGAISQCIPAVLSIEKSTTTTEVTHAGQEIVYQYTVCNIGSSIAEISSVTDTELGAVSVSPTSLAPGACAAGTKTYTVTEEDLSGGQSICNSATVEGTDTCLNNLTNSTGPVCVPINAPASLNITKSGPDSAAVGQTITYTFAVTNTGNVPLANVTVTDPLLGGAIAGPDSGDDGDDVLEDGETWIYTATYTVPAGAPNPIVNTATATGEFEGEQVSDTADWSVQLTIGPAIALEKSGPASAVTGETITYTFTVTNTGNVPLFNVTVIDPLLGGAISGPDSGDNGNSILEESETWTYTSTYTVPEGAPDPIPNTATATGEYEGNVVDDTGNWTVALDITPAINLTKTGPASAVTGETITYTFAVTNTGNVPLVNVTVIDPLLGGAIAGPDSGDDGDDVLEDGETWIYTATYTVPAGAPNPIVNTATATGEFEGEQASDTADWSVQLSIGPAIALEKSGPASAVTGETITYTFTVTNTGNVPLFNVAVADPLAGLSALSGPSGDDGDEILGLTEVWIYTATYTVPEGAPNPILNAATATGNYEGIMVNDTADWSVPLTIIPAINLTKTGPASAVVGETITYAFTVMNTGNVPLSNVAVTDPLLGGAIAGPASGDDGDGVLNLTEVWRYTATYTIPEGAPDPLANTATATGDYRQQAVNDTDDHSVDLVTAPAINISKTAPALAAIGETITYTFTVTNAGNVPLSNVTVTDPLAGMGAITGPSGDDGDGVLELTEVWVYTATYTIPGDAPDPVVNTATATGDYRGQTVNDSDDAAVAIPAPTPTPTVTVTATEPTTVVTTPSPTPTPEPDLCPVVSRPDGPVTVLTGPTVITKPGSYLLDADVMDTDAPVWLEIRASDVIIDGMGHTLDGVDGSGSYGIRVRGDGPLSGITIQNLSVTDFSWGIGLFDASQSRIVLVSAISNTWDGIMIRGGSDDEILCSVIDRDDDGINLTATDGTLVAHNTVTANVRGSGIHLSEGCTGVTLLGNIIGGNDEGVEINDAMDSVIRGNYIYGSQYYGLNLTTAENLAVVDNYFNNGENILPPTGPFSGSWNLEAQPGRNVVGNDRLGGNYWGSPDGTGFSDVTPDGNGDGFCDEAFELPGRIGIDHLPLAPGPLASVADARYSGSSTDSSGSTDSAGSSGSAGSAGSAGDAGAKSTGATVTGTTTTTTLVAGTISTVTAGPDATLTTELTASQGESYGGAADSSGSDRAGGGAASATTVTQTVAGTATPTGITPTVTGTTAGAGAAAGGNAAGAASTPGFGALVALAGLGAVAVLALRRE